MANQQKSTPSREAKIKSCFQL